MIAEVAVAQDREVRMFDETISFNYEASGTRSSYRASSGGGGGGGSCIGEDCRIGGIIAGSVIGGIALIAAILFLSIYCYRRYKK